MADLRLILGGTNGGPRFVTRRSVESAEGDVVAAALDLYLQVADLHGPVREALKTMAPQLVPLLDAADELYGLVGESDVDARVGEWKRRRC